MTAVILTRYLLRVKSRRFLVLVIRPVLLLLRLFLGVSSVRRFFGTCKR